MRTPKKFPARALAKSGTIAAKLAHVRLFLQWCVSQDWLQDNAFKDLKLPTRQVTESRTRKEPLSDPPLIS